VSELPTDINVVKSALPEETVAGVKAVLVQEISVLNAREIKNIFFMANKFKINCLIN